MTGRGLATLWFAAIVLAFGAAAMLAFREPGFARLSSQVSRQVEAGPRVVFIGSSLTEAAIPVHGTLDDLGFRWQRFSLGGLDESRQIVMAEAAVDHGADMLFLEAAAVLRSLRRPLLWPVSSLVAFSNRARATLKRERETDLQKEGAYLGGPGPKGSAEAKVWPLSPNEPERWRSLVQRMHDRGGEVILLGFPAPASLISDRALQEREALAQAGSDFAAYLGVPLFQPDLIWDDSHFADRGHLNASGRERYLRELGAWFEGKQ